MIQFTLFALFDCSFSSRACQYAISGLLHPVLACMSDYKLYLFSFLYFICILVFMCKGIFCYVFNKNK